MRISDWSSDVCSSDLLDTEVTDARFDPADNRWTVTAADGRAWRAPALIVATGQLNRVNIPDIPGREGFAGAKFHTARWDASVDLAGKRVGVIGTDASAIQVVPGLVAQIGSASGRESVCQYG